MPLSPPAGAATAPGPRGWPLLGVLPTVARDPLGALGMYARAHGDVVRVPLGPRAVFLVAHPDHIQHVLVDHAARYDKGATWEKTRAYLGAGLATAEGELWRRQRRLMQPHFHRDALAGIAALMTAAIARTVARLEEAARAHAVVDVFPPLMDMTLDVLQSSLLGGATQTDTSGFTDAFQVALAHTTAKVLRPVDVPDSWPLPSNLRFQRAVAELDRVVFGVVAERRASDLAGARPRDDLLGLLLHAKDPETGDVMSDAQLRDEVVTIFLGGSETSANGLAWAFSLLAQHPAVLARVRAEAAACLGEGPAARAPRAEDMKHLPLCTAVFEEAMRLYPQNWVMSRDTVEDDVIGGFHVPARSTVFIGVHAVHRDPRFWDDPLVFRPERFLPSTHPDTRVDKSAARERHPFAYVPFGAGQRKCIGNQFALMEATFALALFARAFDVERAPGHDATPDAKFNLRPKDGVRVALRPRATT